LVKVVQSFPKIRLNPRTQRYKLTVGKLPGVAYDLATDGGTIRSTCACKSCPFFVEVDVVPSTAQSFLSFKPPEVHPRQVVGVCTEGRGWRVLLETKAQLKCRRGRSSK